MFLKCPTQSGGCLEGDCTILMNKFTVDINSNYTTMGHIGSPKRTLREMHKNVFNMLLRRKRRKLYNSNSGLEIIWYMYIDGLFLQLIEKSQPILLN